MHTAFISQILYDFAMSRRPLDSLSDESLLALIARRDEPAFEVFCKRYLQWAYRFDFKFFQNIHEAEDAVQEKFMRIWCKADLFQPVPGAKVTNYLMKIDKNICLDMLRRQYRRREIPVSFGESTEADAEADLLGYLEFCHLRSDHETPEPEAAIASSELMQQIYDYSLKQFTDNQFLVFWGFVSGMSYKELAATYSMQPGSVRGYVARSFASIRKAFGDRRDNNE